MSKQIIATLKGKLDGLSSYGEIDAETRRNVLKEELQYYVLNFIYHHPEYGKWTMYGGSALRILHGLNRMSVDLDFEISNTITEKFLNKLKEDIEKYFVDSYGVKSDFLTIKITKQRGLLLKFHIGEELSLKNPSKQVHVKIDLNQFVAQNNIVIERIPVNHDQLSFVIVTYNMSALMASKIAAIFLRGVRGVGDKIYEEKGRDIYDLLWYMTKKVVPDLDYLIAKNVDVKDIRTLFNRLTLQMNKVSDVNLKQDITPLFTDQTYIQNWLKTWLDNYLNLLKEYKINTVTVLEDITVSQDFYTDNFSIVYWYKTEEGGRVKIKYNMSDHWITFREGDLPDTVKINDEIVKLVKSDIKDQLNDKLKQYITLYYEKTEAYFKKTNRVMLGDSIVTKVVRMTADNLNQKEQIVLDKSTLLSCELDDLFK